MDCAMRTMNTYSSPNRRRRNTVRLSGYDYARAGAYFLTVCTHNKSCIFGKIIDGESSLNRIGRIVEEEWLKSTRIRAEIESDSWVVMPNHFHAIVFITDAQGRQTYRPHELTSRKTGDRPVAPTGPTPKSLGSLMSGFKSASTVRINSIRNTPRFPVWQRNYHEHIIRGEDSLNRIRQYIIDNPSKWDEDPENPLR